MAVPCVGLQPSTRRPQLTGGWLVSPGGNPSAAITPASLLQAPHSMTLLETSRRRRQQQPLLLPPSVAPITPHLKSSFSEFSESSTATPWIYLWPLHPASWSRGTLSFQLWKSISSSESCATFILKASNILKKGTNCRFLLNQELTQTFNLSIIY